MKQVKLILLGAVLLAGCSASTASSTAAATATPSASANASLTISQTAPVTLSADGVIEDVGMSAITMMVQGTEQSYLKADDFKCDGIMERAAKAEVRYTVDTDGGYVAVSIAVDASVQSLSGTITDEAMNTITISKAVQDSTQDITFAKSEGFVEDDGLETGSLVIVNYTGSLDDSPTAESVLAASDASSITVRGVVEDEAMSTIEIKASADGSQRSFVKSDTYTADGTPSRGSQVLVTCHYENSGFTADSVIVNTAPHTATGTITDEEMSTITINIDGTDVSFLKTDDCVEDDGLETGASVTVNYAGELDGEPEAYAILNS